MSKINARKRGTKWEFRFELTPIGGKRKQYSKSGFNTKKEALQAGAEAYARYNRSGSIYEPKEMSMADYAEYWFKNYVLRHLRENTIRRYRSTLDYHIIPTFGCYNFINIKKATFTEYLNSLANNYSKGTIKQIKAILHGMYEYAIKLEWIENNPLDRVPIPENTKEKQPKDLLTEEGYRKLLEVMPKQHHLPIIIAWHTGMRINEVYSLTWDEIDFSEDLIVVKKQIVYGKVSPVKTKTSERVIRIGDTLKSVLEEERGRQIEDRDFYADLYATYSTDDEMNVIDSKEDDFDFVIRHENGKRMTVEGFESSFYARKKKLGMNISFHSLRHGHATLLIENDASIKAVQSRLGHSSVQITMDVYAHVTRKQEDKAVEIIERIAHEK